MCLTAPLCMMRPSTRLFPMSLSIQTFEIVNLVHPTSWTQTTNYVIVRVVYSSRTTNDVIVGVVYSSAEYESSSSSQCLESYSPMNMKSALLLVYVAHASAFAFLQLPTRVPGFRYPLAMSPKSIAEKVLTNPKWPAEWPYSEMDFRRMDESDDKIFYDTPRLCYHIDDAAVAALAQFYKENLKDGEDVLDICSSWVSHYPKEWKGGNVVGLGMNDYELSKNPQLSSYVVKDLNEDPKFPFDDKSFDKVTCVVSVDYLNKPLEVFKEIGRVLRPGGECIISMSNRCFPTKAFQIWLQTNDLEHIFITGSFFHFSGMFDPPSCLDCSPNPGRSDPLFIVKGARKSA